MAPFNDQFQIGDQLRGANHADGLAGAMGDSVRPGPGAWITIDVGEEVFACSLPARAGAINEGLRRGFVGLTFKERQDEHTAEDCRRKGQRTIVHVQDGFKLAGTYSASLAGTA